MEEGISCSICGDKDIHIMSIHLKSSHDGVSIAKYMTEYPEAPIRSELAEKKYQQKLKEIKNQKGDQMTVADVTDKDGRKVANFHELFGFGDTREAKKRSGEPIQVAIISTDMPELIPDIDPNYVFPLDLTKDLFVAFALSIPASLYGPHGCGKTTQIEQVCARIGRPVIRVQHTVDMESADVVGGMTVENGQTSYRLGPLPYAMVNGLVYIADEYDMALPQICALYQAVLEGKSLMIKDAPPELRKIDPHPEFRLCATGNTNGSGDETGLYAGTTLQNTAGYDRFLSMQVNYMPAHSEVEVVKSQANIAKTDAERLVEFAGRVREAYQSGQLSCTVSTRAIINAAQVGKRRASWNIGIKLAFSNKLPSSDRQAVEEIVSRIFVS